MSGPLHTSKLTVDQGVDFSTTRLFFTPSTTAPTDTTQYTPLDFTGCTARMMARLAQDPTSALLFTGTIGAGLAFVSQTFTPGPPQPSVNNGITITITRAQTLAMNGGVACVGYYDLFIDQPGSTTLFLMSGPFEVVATATR